MIPPFSFNKKFVLCNRAKRGDSLAIAVFVNDVQVVYTSGLEPFVQGDNFRIPVRDTYEAMGGIVTWDGISGSAIVEIDGHTIELIIGSTTAIVDGNVKDLFYNIEIHSDRMSLITADISRFLSKWTLSIEGENVYYTSIVPTPGSGIWVKKNNWIKIPIKNEEPTP